MGAYVRVSMIVPNELQMVYGGSFLLNATEAGARRCVE